MDINKIEVGSLRDVLSSNFKEQQHRLDKSLNDLIQKIFDKNNIELISDIGVLLYIRKSFYHADSILTFKPYNEFKNNISVNASSYITISNDEMIGLYIKDAELYINDILHLPTYNTLNQKIDIDVNEFDFSTEIYLNDILSSYNLNLKPYQLYRMLRMILNCETNKIFLREIKFGKEIDLYLDIFERLLGIGV